MKIKGGNNKMRVRQRQDEAVQRQETRDNRTHEQQLELINKRPGESKKEKYKLVKLIKDAYNKNKNKK